MRQNTEQDFWNRVEVKNKNECWNWLGSLRGEYGNISWNNKTTSSHRLAFELVYGDIPDDLDVLHNCFNKLCCNPYHLRLGTDTDNRQDKDFAKVNWDIVHEIRQRYTKRGKDNCYSLGKEFNLSYQQIWNIVTNREWIE